ncbi:MAG TPA: hypothetical protein VLC91_00305 [Spongiibacteraceae bacterium]|nr:hypothetical protein [Spongiibacteraceae bacterium]
MPNFVRLPLFAAIVLLGPAYVGSLHADSEAVDPDYRESALDDSSAGSTAPDKQAAAADTPSWLDGIRNNCAQQYSAEQCRDDEFLEQNFHVNDLQAAHRAAVRRKEMEQSALRELLLQRTCGNPAAYCAINTTADCATQLQQQLQQMCASIQQQTANCLNTATQYCASAGQSSNCLAQRRALCPTAIRQPIDTLLAKYPKLTLQQQMHVRQVAQQMDANQGGSWIGNLFRWLGF